MKEILPFLLVLACPLMMILMMRGMHGRGSHDAQGQAGSTRHAVRSGESSAGSMNTDELRRLRDDFEARLQELDDRLYELETRQDVREPVGA